MITKKVPLTIYDKDGRRTVIGDAVVDIEGDTLGVVARITDGRVLEGIAKINVMSFGPLSLRGEETHGDS